MKILLNHLTNVLKKIIELHFIFATSGIKKCLKMYCVIYFDFFRSQKNTQMMLKAQKLQKTSCITYGTLGVEGIWAKCLAVHILVDICYDI